MNRTSAAIVLMLCSIASVFTVHSQESREIAANGPGVRRRAAGSRAYSSGSGCTSHRDGNTRSKGYSAGDTSGARAGSSNCRQGDSIFGGNLWRLIPLLTGPPRSGMEFRLIERCISAWRSS